MNSILFDLSGKLSCILLATRGLEYSSPMTPQYISSNKISAQTICHHIIQIFHLMNGSHGLAHDKVLTFACTKLCVFYKPPPPNRPRWWGEQTWYEWMISAKLTWSQQYTRRPVSQTSPTHIYHGSAWTEKLWIAVPTLGSLKFHFHVGDNAKFTRSEIAVLAIHSLMVSDKLERCGFRWWYEERWRQGTRDLRYHALLPRELMYVSDNVKDSFRLSQFQCIFWHFFQFLRVWTKPTGNKTSNFLGAFGEHACTIVHNIRDIANFLSCKAQAYVRTYWWK